MQGGRTARLLAGLGHAVLDLHDVLLVDIPTLHSGRGDEEVVVPPTHGHGAVGAAHEVLVAGAAHHAAYLRADGPLVRRM